MQLMCVMKLDSNLQLNIPIMMKCTHKEVADYTNGHHIFSYHIRKTSNIGAQDLAGLQMTDLDGSKNIVILDWKSAVSPVC